MKELPEGWISEEAMRCFVQISTNNKKVKTKDCKETGKYPVIDQGQDPIAGYVDDPNKLIEISEPVVIFGDHTRTIKWVDNDFVPGADGIKVLCPQKFLNNRYFYLQLKSIEFPNKGYSRHFKFFKDINIVVAPYEEQIRIANKLDSLLAKVEAAQAHLEKIPTLFKRFRQSVLAAATSGELTKEWRRSHSVGTGQNVIEQDSLAKEELCRQQPELRKKKSSIQSAIDKDYMFDIPSTWAFTSWGKVSEWITYGFTRPMPKSETGIKLLTAKDVQFFKIDIENSGVTTESAFINLSDKDKPNAGDLLITKDGTIGRAALVRTENPFCINQSVAVCWLRSTSMNKSYLELVANSEFTQKFAKDKAQGMAIQHLSIIDFAKCPLPTPPIEEQNEIVRRVESLYEYSDTVERQYIEVKKRIDRLTQSILAKAFRGELVPQDPTDEPASELLKRVQLDRARADSQKKAQRPMIESQSQSYKAGYVKAEILHAKKVIPMKLKDAPKRYLGKIIENLGGEVQAEELWQRSEMNIDDFYAKLKEEMRTFSIVDDNSSSDPALRKLKIARQSK